MRSCREQHERPRVTELPDNRPIADPIQIFTVLNAHNVDYTVIGGVAVVAWGHTRNTRDVDILASPDHANLKRLEAALLELRARLSGVDAHNLDISLDAATLGNGDNFTLETIAGSLDYFSEVPGGDTYSKIKQRSVLVLVGDTQIRIVALEDLIRMKLAAGRDQDLQDVAVLNSRVDAD